jgi:hypothetical protein
MRGECEKRSRFFFTTPRLREEVGLHGMQSG